MDAEIILGLCAAFLCGALVVYLALARPARARAKALYERLLDLDKKRYAIGVELDAERKRYQEREEQFSDRFAKMASDALRQNSTAFLKLVSERFEKHKSNADRDLSVRQTAIENLVKPIGEELGKFERRVGQIEKEREGAYRSVTEQVRSLKEGQEGLRYETGRLAQALRMPKARGRWGEIQLQRVLEIAGMSEHVDFRTQVNVTGDGNTLRPDVIVSLPGGKRLVIDAKTPLEGFLRSFEAEGEKEREQALQDHARHLQKHVKELASKKYWGRLQYSPDFVVMFVPGESLYDAAARTDPAIFENAVQKGVLIATPTTLIALLRAVALGWQQQKLAENAQDVAKGARDLYRRVGVFVKHMDGLGKSLRQAVGRYNKSVGSLESRVLPGARRFADLGVASEQEPLSELEPVSMDTRAINARELTGGASPAREDR